MTEQVTDIHNPNGAWKVEPNGTHMVAVAFEVQKKRA